MYLLLVSWCGNLWLVIHLVCCWMGGQSFAIDIFNYQTSGEILKIINGSVKFISKDG